MSEVSPLPWETILKLLEDAARRYAEREAVVDGDVRIEFPAVLNEAQRTASALRAVGIGFGDLVAIWGSNRWRWVVAACGVGLQGTVLVPLATR